MCFCCVDFFFKQKTAYEMRISDWSSDVCSSDLADVQRPDRQGLSGLGIATCLLRSDVQQGQRIEGNLALLVGRDDHDARAAFSLDFSGNAAGAAGVGFGVELAAEQLEMGRASGRERVCQYV